MYRYFRKRKAVSTTVGFHVNGSASCEPGLSPRVSIGIFCSWDEKRADLRNNSQMSAELEAVGAALLAGSVPTAWAARAYPSTKPLGAWYEDLHARLDFVQTWVDAGAPHAFWMPGFFFPRPFPCPPLCCFCESSSKLVASEITK